MKLAIRSALQEQCLCISKCFHFVRVAKICPKFVGIFSSIAFVTNYMIFLWKHLRNKHLFTPHSVSRGICPKSRIVTKSANAAQMEFKSFLY